MNIKVLITAIIAIIAIAAVAAVVLSDDNGTETGTQATINGWTWDYSGSTVKSVTGSGTTITLSDWPTGITSIADGKSGTTTSGAFMKCKNLQSVTIPDSVKSIGGNAFRDLTSLKSVGLPSQLEFIQGSAFRGTGLTSIYIPANVTHIVSGVFADCKNLSTINVSANPNYTLQNGMVYSADLTELLICPGAKSGAVSIPSTTLKIGAQAFDGCSKITSVNLPSSIISLEFSAFNGCSSLTSINIPDGIDSIPNYLFKDCTSLASVKIPANVTNIGYSAFNNTAITSISLPSGLKSIGDTAFSYSKLRSVIVPGGVSDLGASFMDCPDLRTAVLDEGITAVTTSLFYNCPSLVSVTLPSTIGEIGELSFAKCTSLASITIPENVKSIGDVAFWKAPLTSIDVPMSVDSIGSRAFDECTNLEYALVPEHTTIASDSFPATTQIIPKLDFSTYPTADMIIRQVANMQYEFSTTTAGRAVWDIEGAAYEGSIVKHTFDKDTTCKVILTIYDENGKITHKTERVLVVSSETNGGNDDTGSNSHNWYTIGVAASAFFAAICFAGYLLVPGARRNKIFLIAGIALALIAIALAIIGGLL